MQFQSDMETNKEIFGDAYIGSQINQVIQRDLIGDQLSLTSVYYIFNRLSPFPLSYFRIPCVFYIYLHISLSSFSIRRAGQGKAVEKTGLIV